MRLATDRPRRSGRPSLVQGRGRPPGMGRSALLSSRRESRPGCARALPGGPAGYYAGSRAGLSFLPDLAAPVSGVVMERPSACHRGAPVPNVANGSNLRSHSVRNRADCQAAEWQV